MGVVSQRQRFLDTLLGEGSDRFPFFDLEPDPDTHSRWVKEGFPPEGSFSDYFALETHYSVGLMLRSYPFFQMAPDLLHDPSAFNKHYNPDQAARYEADVKRAVEDTVPDLLEKGHYLPCLDDRPRSNIPFAHYRLYRRLLEDISRSC